MIALAIILITEYVWTRLPFDSHRYIFAFQSSFYAFVLCPIYIENHILFMYNNTDKF